ncbi:MAG: Na+:solute symporter [Candidatus Marinimicrobia bacterium]|nr:Na+:solute symporter [Candidatus Neomarinimicrobiota bacterium]MBL7022618.1 Na+:solute symporter [Candidatus Neomarinimicrobiota bacterium]MBL7109639.1 Na+:solute symporter [Candidatus Neomarinimicrobiota bacterium]
MFDKFAILDWIIISVYILFMLAVGLWMRKRASRSTEQYFTGGREMPWWLAGVSMVATTFAADTPLAVTGIVASDGIAGNWIWWNFMVSGMFTVFLYAKLWHRAGVITDVEFIELRYGGKPASILRGFRALYLAFPINCIILGWVTLGMSKVLEVMTGASSWKIIIILYGLTAIYIVVSGLWGVVVTDFLQFFIAMAGSIVLMFYAINEVGGMNGLMSGLIEQFGVDHHYLDFSPIGHPKILLSTALVWIGMQWWVSWYPGAEPGGGGYIAQRMFSTRSDKDAVKSTLFFNIAHYALRPWPWIIVALASLIVYPNIADPEKGYAMMMVDLLPAGLFGLLAVAFFSAFMSTVSTHLNWGASYVVNDFYARFIRPKDSFTEDTIAQRHYIMISRLATLLMMVVAIVVSYFFDSVKSGWEMILSLGAGTGLVFMLRWYWWRINAWSEISAMSAAFVGSLSAGYFGFEGFADKMIFTTIFTTIIWMTVTYVTQPENNDLLQNFYNKVKPAGPGWELFSDGKAESILPALVNVQLGVISVLGFLFGVGNLIFGNTAIGCVLFATALISIKYLVGRIGED